MTCCWAPANQKIGDVRDHFRNHAWISAMESVKRPKGEKRQLVADLAKRP